MALCKYLSVSKDNLAVGNGSIELIYLLPKLLKAKRALIVEPAFGEYAKSLELAGCEVESFLSDEKKGFRLNTEALIKRLKASPELDLLYMANPANPTGVLTPLVETARILKVCEEQGIIFVVDEAFADFSPKASVLSLVKRSESLVVFRSMTKFFSLAGLRLGAIIASNDIIEGVINERVPWSVNSLALAAGLGSLEDDDHISDVRAWFTREREFMSKELSSIKGLTLYPSSANFFMLKATGGADVAVSLRERLLADKILIRALGEFIGLGEDFFRVAVRERKDNIRLIERIRSEL